MKPEISLITIWTDNIGEMKRFYQELLGFPVKNDLGEYVEFVCPGVRFALCRRSVMYPYTNHYRTAKAGQAFELAFPCDSVEDLDQTYRRLIAGGAAAIHETENMPWNQRTALFADPDGNIHEIYTEL